MKKRHHVRSPIVKPLRAEFVVKVRRPDIVRIAAEVDAGVIACGERMCVALVRLTTKPWNNLGARRICNLDLFFSLRPENSAPSRPAVDKTLLGRVRVVRLVAVIRGSLRRTAK